MTRRRELGLAFAAALGFALLTAPTVPASDDARFYLPAAESLGDWLLSMARFEPGVFGQGATDRAFSPNHEHPPVAKAMMALGILVLHRGLGWLSELAAARTGVMLLFALALACLYDRLRRHTGRLAAGIGCAGLMSLPRLVYDTHAETLDGPMAALGLLWALATFSSLETPNPRRVAVSVGLFALCLDTKLNAPFLLLGLGLYVLLRRPILVSGERLRLPEVPWPLALGVLVAPLLAWLLWPWLWHDTAARLGEYIAFHQHHYGILFYFLGDIYGEQVAPVWAPSLMLLLTVPVPLLLLAFTGALRPAWIGIGQLPVVHRRDLATAADLEAQPKSRLGLFALCLFASQLVAVSLPGVPKYGGVKLFAPAFPFLGILIGLGADRVLHEVAELPPRLRRFAPAAVVTAALLPSVVACSLYAGAWLSYYNELAGFVRGAAAMGLEQQYYDLAYPELATALGAALPNGGGVAFLPNPKEYGPHLSRFAQEGDLPPGIRLAPVERADVLVLTHERRWQDYPELMARYRTRPLLYRHRIAGVPLFSVYDLRGH